MFRHIKIMECWKRRCVTRTPQYAHGSSSTPAPLTALTYGACSLSALDDELWLSGGQMWLVPAQVHCTRRFACHAPVPSTISMINLQITLFVFLSSLCLEYACISSQRRCRLNDISDWNTQIEWFSFQRHSGDISLLFFLPLFYMLLVLAKFNYIYTRTRTCHSSVIITKYK